MNGRADREDARSPRQRRGAALAACLLAACALESGAARAQQVGDNFVTPDLPLDYDRGRNLSVLDRPRPEYAAIGVPVGGFLLLPRIEGGFGYSDNVYAAARERAADGFGEVNPSAQLNSNWNRNALNFDGGYHLRRYLRESRRDEDGWNAGVAGRYDISGTLALSGDARVRRATEPPTSAAYPSNAAEPSQYRQATGRLVAAYSAGRVKTQLSANFGSISFDPVRTLAGAVIDQHNRDAESDSGTARVEYALSPDTAIFAQGSYERTVYAIDLEPGVANRDSATWRGLIGITFDVSTKVRGAAGIGYIDRRYDSRLYGDIGGISGELRLEYFLSALTTIGLTGRRIVQDAAFINAGGFVNTSIAARIDHELLRNLLLNAQIAYEKDRYSGIDATLDIVRASIGARHMATREIGLGMIVSRDSRTARGALAGTGYGETRVILSLAVQK